MFTLLYMILGIGLASEPSMARVACVSFPLHMSVGEADAVYAALRIEARKVGAELDWRQAKTRLECGSDALFLQVTSQSQARLEQAGQPDKTIVLPPVDGAGRSRLLAAQVMDLISVPGDPEQSALLGADPIQNVVAPTLEDLDGDIRRSRPKAQPMGGVRGGLSFLVGPPPRNMWGAGLEGGVYRLGKRWTVLGAVALVNGQWDSEEKEMTKRLFQAELSVMILYGTTLSQWSIRGGIGGGFAKQWGSFLVNDRDEWSLALDPSPVQGLIALRTEAFWTRPRRWEVGVQVSPRIQAPGGTQMWVLVQVSALVGVKL